MADMMQATQDAVFAALDAAHKAVNPSLATVRQHVPENTLPPLVIVGDMDAENVGGKGERTDKIVIDVVSIYRGTARRGLLAIMAINRDALEDQEISAPGAAFSTPRFLSANTALGEDGATYAGVQQFEIYAEPA
ncbi:MAG TPA: DUF3168 domain-containing protein [Rhizomicrobium sp.]|jgi:hypothetical protein|nr:DUF3168 domain-containing protein [Rhizomicrobium sp.]